METIRPPRRPKRTYPRKAATIPCLTSCFALPSLGHETFEQYDAIKKELLEKYKPEDTEWLEMVMNEPKNR